MFLFGMIVGGTITLFLHCCLIVAKESDKKWEEGKITKKDENKE